MALNYDGKVVSVGDEVTIMGSVNTVTGSGGLAVVTVIPLRSTSAFTAQANDMNAVQHAFDATHTATSISGKAFGVGDRVSVLGSVTAVSGTDGNALLTVILCTSGLSVSVPAASVHSLQFNG